MSFLCILQRSVCVLDESLVCLSADLFRYIGVPYDVPRCRTWHM